MTSPYHPMSNGTVERFHRDLNAMLRKFSNGNNTLWEEYLPHALLAARNTVNSRTGHTPFYLLYGRDAIMPLDTILAPRRKGYSDDFLSDMLKRQSRAFEVVKENTTEMRRKNREYHDKKVKLQNYVVGDLCYYNDRAKYHNKLDIKWKGQYRIVDKAGPVNFKIREISTGNEKWVHANDLRLANPEVIWEHKIIERNVPVSQENKSRDSYISREDIRNAQHSSNNQIFPLIIQPSRRVKFQDGILDNLRTSAGAELREDSFEDELMDCDNFGNILHLKLCLILNQNVLVYRRVIVREISQLLVRMKIVNKHFWDN